MATKKEQVALELKKEILLDVVSENDEEEDFSGEDSDSKTSGTTANDESVQIGRTEGRMVTGSKIVVFSVLAIATAGCAIGTYWFTANADNQAFEASVSYNISCCVKSVKFSI